MYQKRNLQHEMFAPTYTKLKTLEERVTSKCVSAFRFLIFLFGLFFSFSYLFAAAIASLASTWLAYYKIAPRKNIISVHAWLLSSW